MAELKVKFSADISHVQDAIRKINSSLDTIKSTASKVGAGIKAALGPLAMVTGALGGAAVVSGKQLLDFAGNLQDLSDVTGISVRNLTVLGEAFERAGMDIASIQNALVRLSTNLANPSTATIEAFDLLGMSLENIRDLSPEEQFKIIGTAIGNLSNQNDKLYVTSRLFGKGFSDLIRLFKDGNVFADAEKYAGGLGNRMTVLAPVLEGLGDAIGGIKTKMLDLFASIAMGIGTENLENLTEWLNNLDFTRFGEGIANVLENITQDISQLGWWGAIKAEILNVLKSNELKSAIGELTGTAVDSLIQSPDALKVGGGVIGGIAGYTLLKSALGKAIEASPALLTNPVGIGVAGGLAAGGGAFKMASGGMDFTEALSYLFGGEGNSNLKEIERQLVESRNRIKNAANQISENSNSIYSPSGKTQGFSMRVANAEETKRIINAVKNSMQQSSYDDYLKVTKKDPISISQDLYRNAVKAITEGNKKELSFDVYKPIVSSLQRIGGVSGLTGESMPSLQRIANNFLEKIAKNTEKFNPTPVWT